MALTATQVAEQKKEVEELIAGPDVGFAKALFFGKFKGELLFPYPVLPPDQQAKAEAMAKTVRDFANLAIDAAAIDRQARIPDGVIQGLAGLGVYRLTIPVEYGGMGFNQQMYLKTMEVFGGHDSSVAVFVNAHHSIGCRALVLFGTKEQQARWLPGLLDGSKLCAFALSEPEAGSDAGNVQTTAKPTSDGSAYILNGTKHYITNGGIADVLTVMARTPAPTPEKPDATKITAFLVTPDLPGFEVLEARAEKCGIRGTATGKLRFTNMRVPRENILGPVGKGLKVALTVLDFGRTTFGASCTGHAKGLPQGNGRAREAANPVPATTRRVPACPEEGRVRGGPHVRDGGRDHAVRCLHRPRLRGLHARNGDPQGLRHRALVDNRERHAPGLGWEGVFLRPAAGTVDAGCADQLDW
jgi:acyl-CoA dehydrogenase family protein 9